MLRNKLVYGILQQMDEAIAPRLGSIRMCGPLAARYWAIAAHSVHPSIPNTSQPVFPDLEKRAHLLAVADTRSIRSSCFLATHSSDGNRQPLPSAPHSRLDVLASTEHHMIPHRWVCSAADTSKHADQTSDVFPSFPKDQGGIIMGPIKPLDEVRVSEEVRKILNSTVFDHEYQHEPVRTGRKQLGRMLKGDEVADYYLDKNTDPLLTNIEGQEKAMMRRERNERGFKRRRPQKKTPEAAAKAAKKKKK